MDWAHWRITSAKAVSVVTLNLSWRIVFANDREIFSPSSGKIARFFGSTQNTSGSSRASDIGKIPMA
jgi:hypothetical protein